MTRGNVNARIAQVLGQINEDEVIAFHRDLVRIPSVNPPGDVRQAIDFVEAPLSAAGFRTEQVSSHELMPNLIARIGDGDGPRLAFNAHVDVVPIGDESAWKHAPFGAELVDGRIYGRGAGDDKASVTAQVMAGLALVRSNVPFRGELILNEVADEEAGGTHGAKFVVAEHGFRPDMVIVGEQTLNHVALGEKGSAPTEIRVTGRIAHGALPWQGANAIEAMAEVMVALRREYWPILETRTHKYFHHSSGSVNMITGGVKNNVVPDQASVYVDRRIVPGEEPEQVYAEINTIAQRALRDFDRVTVTVGEAFEGTRSTLQDEDSPLVCSMVEANRTLGLSTDLTGFSMATDGRFFTPYGIPTIIYGPGDPKLAHVPDEWVGVDEIMQATRAYAMTATTLLA